MDFSAHSCSLTTEPRILSSILNRQNLQFLFRFPSLFSPYCMLHYFFLINPGYVVLHLSSLSEPAYLSLKNLIIHCNFIKLQLLRTKDSYFLCGKNNVYQETTFAENLADITAICTLGGCRRARVSAFMRIKSKHLVRAVSVQAHVESL